MTDYQTIYEDAIDNYGLVTTKRAKELGLAPNALALLAHRGRLERVGHGVYRPAAPIPFAGETPSATGSSSGWSCSSRWTRGRGSEP